MYSSENEMTGIPAVTKRFCLQILTNQIANPTMIVKVSMKMATQKMNQPKVSKVLKFPGRVFVEYGCMCRLVALCIGCADYIRR